METLAAIAAIAALFLWVRAEANADRRHISQMQREDRKDILSMVEAIKEDVRAIQNEVKDFHMRLCTIEERNKGK